jgi:hypothetical protein
MQAPTASFDYRLQCNFQAQIAASEIHKVQTFGKSLHLQAHYKHANYNSNCKLQLQASNCKLLMQASNASAMKLQAQIAPAIASSNYKPQLQAPTGSIIPTPGEYTFKLNCHFPYFFCFLLNIFLRVDLE